MTLLLLRPTDERKNPDWSELIKSLIDCSDWSVICHSSTLASSQLHATREMIREVIFFSVFKEHSSGRKQFQVRVQSRAEENNQSTVL